MRCPEREASGRAEVERGLNDGRLAVLGVLVAIGLGVAALAPGPGKLGAGIGGFALACVLIRWRWSRARLMEFAHWLTGQ